MDDTELIKFAEEFRDGLLGGRSSHLMCHVVSYPLSGLLNASGVECEIAVGDIGFCNHVWIKLADGRILDPTIDQFSQYDWCPPGKIYLGERLPFVIEVLDENDPIWMGADWHERSAYLCD